MRIGILTHEYPPFNGGIARYVVEIGKAAARRGANVVIHAPDYGKVDSDRSFDGVRVVRFKGGVFRKERGLWTYVSSLHRFLWSQQFDIIHVADWPPLVICGALPTLFSRIQRTSIITTLYGSDVLNLSHRKRNAYFANRVFRTSHRLAAISRHTAVLFLDKFPKSGTPVVVHLGVSPFWLGAYDQVLASAGSPRKVISVGRLVPDKGHATVIEALAQLANPLRAAIEYVMVGTGAAEYQQYLKALAGKHGVSIRFAGHVSDDELAVLYRSAWINVLASRSHPSRTEGFGLVVLEAAALGLPSIGTRVGGIPDLIKDGVTGFLVDEGDAGAMADVFQRLASNPQSRDRLGQAARSLARTFTWDRTAQETYGLH